VARKAALIVVITILATLATVFLLEANSAEDLNAGGVTLIATFYFAVATVVVGKLMK
jgi:hypothetical protein